MARIGWVGGLFLCSAALASEPLSNVIVTATRHEERLRDFPGSISVIGERELMLVGSTHHAELTNRAAGVMIQRNSGQESLTAIRSPVLSGPGSCGAFLFLENSIPIRPVGFCNVNELFEVNTEQAQLIEVLRGPAGVVYGSGAMHGAVNVLQASPDRLPALGFGVQSGPDEYLRGELSLSHLGEATDLGLNALYTHDGGWRDDSGLEEQKLNATLKHRSENARMGLHLAATNLHQETAGFIQGEGAYRDRRIARSNSNPEAYRNAYAVRLSGEYRRSLSESSELSVFPYVRHSRMDFLQHFLVGKPTEENGQDSIGVLSSLRFDAFDSTSFLVGLDVEFANGYLKETQAGPATDGALAANAIRPAGKHYDYAVDSSVAAAYVQVDQPFAERWKLSAGARLDYVNYDYDNKMSAGNARDDGSLCAVAGGCLYTRPASRSDRFTSPTAKIAITYALTNDHVLYGSAARGYRAPDTSELYRLQRQQTVADLSEEKLDSLEFGVRGAHRALRYSLAAFAMKKTNVIFRDADAFNVSDGRTKHRGIEYEFGWSMLPTLDIELAGTYARHTYDFNRSIEQGEIIVAGRDVDTAPRHINAARVRWTPRTPATVELEWVGVGRYFVDAQNAHEYTGHDLLNLRLDYQLMPRLSGTLQVNNVTDRAYADRADYAFGNYRYFPGRDRTVFIEMRYRSE